jgi:hypothetical protein
MRQVKLIIATTFTDTVWFNYGDDYSDITRVMVEDHSPWEEVDEMGFSELEQFVRDFNNNGRKTNDGFAFLIQKEKQISAQSAIKQIVEKREAALKKAKEEARKRKELEDKKKADAKLKRLAKTKEQKLKLFEQLKEELKLDVIKFEE